MRILISILARQHHTVVQSSGTLALLGALLHPPCFLLPSAADCVSLLPAWSVVLQAYDSAAQTVTEAGNKMSETMTSAQNSASETAQQVRP